MAGYLEELGKTKKAKVNPYLEALLKELGETYGCGSRQYNGIYNQFFKMPDFDAPSFMVNDRHYHAEAEGNGIPKGVERLYKRHLVIDLTQSCAAECSYCLRGNYGHFTLNREERRAVADYCKDQESTGLKEVLITGGDPLTVPAVLVDMVQCLTTQAPNIRVIRIGSRLPVHNPSQFSDVILDMVTSYPNIIFEFGIQINHAVELTPSARSVLMKLRSTGAKIYAQNVLLKGVNDDIESLIELYDELRYLGIEAHYLFHAIPMKGTQDFRTTIKRGLDLIKELTSSGNISGRCKPMYSLMTDVGKVTLYEDTIATHSIHPDTIPPAILKMMNQSIEAHGVSMYASYTLIQTKYRLDDRLKWNPNYTLPSNAYVDEEGFIVVAYLDGNSL